MNPHEPDDDLRALVSGAVDDVDPTDRLAEIRLRTQDARGRSRRGWYAAGGSALVAAAAVVTVAVVAQPGSGPGRTADPASDQPSVALQLPPDPPASTDDTTAQAVYYVGETPTGPRLFREYRQVDRAERRDVLALATTQGAALDPDYRTAWPEPLTDWSFDGIGDDGTIAVVVPDDLVERPPGMSDNEANLAIQQVVFTLQGETSSKAPVVFYLESGDSTSTVLGVSYDLAFVRLDDALSPVSISDPVEGLRVQDSFTARGVALSFEATVPWAILDGDREVVLQGSAMAQDSTKLSAWETTIDVSGLAPGAYWFQAATDDPSGGEGPGATVDDRVIVVEEPTTDTEAPDLSGGTTTAYFVGPGPDGPDAPAAALYRYEEPAGPPLEVLTRTPSDPDYRTLWPTGAFVGASEPEAGMVFVDLADGSFRQRPAGMSPTEAGLAVEQVIWTMQDYAGEEVAVQFRVGGNPVDQVFGVPTSEPLAHAGPLTVLSHMGIDHPLEGDTVSGSFTAAGQANGFEGTVFCQLLDADGEAAWQDATINGGLLDDTIDPWSLDVDLREVEPGDYTFRCRTDDPTGGAEGRGADVDTRSITVT